MFTSTGSTHDRQETTLLSMILLLLYRGMIVLGLPYQHNELLSIEAGGTSYGPSHAVHRGDTASLIAHKRTLATAMGRQLVWTALELIV